jgi:hypothetical protein
MPLYAPPDMDERTIVMFLGLDQNGVALEVGAVEVGPDELIVIHAMRLRKRFRADFERVMRGYDR